MRSDKDLAKAKMKVAVALGGQRAAEARREADARREQLRRALGRLKRQLGKRYAREAPRRRAGRGWGGSGRKGALTLMLRRQAPSARAYFQADAFRPDPIQD